MFISGRGSNLAALLELRSEIEIRLVVSSQPDAVGLLRARRAGVKTLVAPTADRNPQTDLKSSKRIDWDALFGELKARGISHIVLAGFMKIVPKSFIRRFPQGHMVNLHPSLLPLYPGLRSIERAYHDGEPLGASVHEVVEAVDAGRILAQVCTLPKAISGGAAKVASAELPPTLLDAEFLVHVDEQRLLRRALGQIQARERLKVLQNGD